MSSTISKIYEQLPSPPSSPNQDHEKSFCCNDVTEKKDLLDSPKESTIEIFEEEEKEEEIANDLRKQYMNWMEEGFLFNDDRIPYAYVIEKLHQQGAKIINKRTRDALPLRVYEIEKDRFEDYWVHPTLLSLQSFQFYKLFEEVKGNGEQGCIEIEVPSLSAFPVLLYYLYTGDRSKLLEIAKLDETLCKGIIETINYLEIEM